MTAAYLLVTSVAIAANAFSGITALLRFQPILSGMAAANVPESWLVFPIGMLKTTGAVGLLLGLVGIPHIGTAAAVGLVLFFACAVHTHLLANDHSPQLTAAAGFLGLAVTTLTLDLLAT